MNKFVFCLHKKATLWACLFLCVIFSASAQEWTFDANIQKAYDLALNLQTSEVHELIPNPKTVQEHYVTALAEALELLITEDGEKFTQYEERYEQRLERKTKITSPHDLFLQAEIALQWTFVHLKFGHEFDAALNLRQAYQTTQEIKKRFPDFTAIQKTSGLLDVIIGSVPEKYNWIMGLLNMEGSVDMGLHELESIRKSDHVLALESNLLFAITQSFILQQTDAGLQEVTNILKENPTNRLALFLAAALALKNSNSEDALGFLHKLGEQRPGIPIYYADYLRGEIYLHKGQYLNSISAYRWFINHYKGQNYIKDAHYKIGICYWLNGNEVDAHVLFFEARKIGKESTEADKYAARSLAEEELPHLQLTQARYAIDGGYYEQAAKILRSIVPTDLKTDRDKVEYLYRKARIAHKTNSIGEAKELYLQTIEMNGESPWYFAPNACLQLGYILADEKNESKALFYFKKAIEYKKHEYKNSIDSKAKSAIAHMNKKKRQGKN